MRYRVDLRPGCFLSGHLTSWPDYLYIKSPRSSVLVFLSSSVSSSICLLEAIAVQSIRSLPTFVAFDSTKGPPPIHPQPSSTVSFTVKHDGLLHPSHCPPPPSHHPCLHWHHHWLPIPSRPYRRTVSDHQLNHPSLYYRYRSPYSHRCLFHLVHCLYHCYSLRHSLLHSGSIGFRLLCKASSEGSRKSVLESRCEGMVKEHRQTPCLQSL